MLIRYLPGLVACLALSSAAPAGASPRLLRASLPARGQPGADPVAPLSIYLGTPVDPTTFQAELRSGASGPPIGPLAFHWDLPGISFSGAQGFEHVVVDHPSLPASPRPYNFVVTKLLSPPAAPGAVLPPFSPGPPYDYGKFVVGFTVGPALAGDLNGDGMVTAADAVLALRAALGLEALTQAQRFATDLVPHEGVNGREVGGGAVDVGDATYILRRALGFVPDDQWP